MSTLLGVIAIAQFLFVPVGLGLIAFRRGHRKWWVKVTGANVAVLLVVVVAMGIAGIGGDATERGFTSADDYREAKRLGLTTKAEYDAHIEAKRAETAAKAEQAKREAEAAKKLAAAEAAKKDAECRQDLRCWAEKNKINASIVCERLIPRLAKYDTEWTSSWYESKFSHFRWADKAKGHVTYIGDKMKFQNGFGAWQHVVYECDYDPASQVAYNARAEAGRLPN